MLPIVRDIATGSLTVAAPTVTAIDPNSARVDFAAAPTADQYQLTLLAVAPSV